MPTETRQICFDLEEVGQALLDLRRRCGKRVSGGEIVDPAIRQDAASRNITFAMQVVGEDGGLDRLIAGEAELGTALIYFCRQQKIPLPIRANKLVGIVNGSLALVCVRERKDFLPLEMPACAAADASGEGETGQAAATIGELPDAEPPSMTTRALHAGSRLERARRRLRERATS